MTRSFLRYALRAFVLGAAVLSASAALAFSGPPGSPTTCPSGYSGCDAPLNVSSSGQTKNGPLTVSYGGGGSISIYGYNNGGGYGVYGNATSGNGIAVRGDGGSSNWGGYFTGGYGVYGQGSGYGVYGYSTGSYGVYGQTSANSYAGYFYAPASGAVGVRADGNAYGVYGYNTQTGVVGILGYGAYGLYSSGAVAAYPSNSGYWAGDFRAAGPYGMYVQNSSGYYSELSYSSYGLATNGAISAPSYYYNSDARLKKDVAPLSDSLSKVLQLKPVTYEWKDSLRGAGTQLGFIAQDVEKVVPELVREDPATSMLSVDYGKVTPLLVGAVQAQQKEIDGLKAQLAAQDARLSALEAKVDAR